MRQAGGQSAGRAGVALAGQTAGNVVRAAGSAMVGRATGGATSAAGVLNSSRHALEAAGGGAMDPAKAVLRAEAAVSAAQKDAGMRRPYISPAADVAAQG